MNGIINVLKPAGMTSFDVVAFLRRVSGQKKIGHTGTLDPMAVGVLPVCLGSATKAIEFMMEKDKVYRAEMSLGISTDTEDSTGQVLKYSPCSATNEEINKAISTFVGDIAQIPPMYSALKVNGKKLYELARQGQVIEREARNITVYSIDVIKIWKDRIEASCDGKLKEYEVVKVLMDVHCSKGTYIRTLCNDIGHALNCGACMSFLIRKAAGEFDLSNAISIEEITDLSDKGHLNDALLPVERVFLKLPHINLSHQETFKYSNGTWIDVSVNKDLLYRIYDNNSCFLGLGETFETSGKVMLKSRKFF